MVRGAARLVLWAGGMRMQVRHLEHLPRGACVVVANHASYLDGVVLFAALPPRFGFVIKREVSKLPLASLLLGRSALIVSATWVVTTIAVRAAIGGFEWPALTLQDNLAHVPSAAINLFLFLGLTALLAIAGFRQAPRPARLAMIAATPLLLAVALFGFCWDVRLLTPLYPLVAPLVLSAALEVPSSVTHG